jgi:MYXO-CTERM domain-containing protein
MMRRAVGLVAGLLGLACAGEPDANVAVERAAIVNGEPSDETDDNVVRIAGQISETFKLACTGTLIAPNVVLTALHCVSYRADPNATFACNPDGMIDPSVPGAGSLGAPIAGEDVEVFFGAMPDGEPDAYGDRVFGSGATQICRGDIAVVVLDRDLSQNVAPLRFGRGVTIGETMKIVGYGQTEQPTSQGRYRRGNQRVLDVGMSECGPGSSTTPPETFVLGQGACHGDSGGPAFSEETGALAGVYSLSLAPSCTSIGVRNTFVVVPSFEGMIRAALQYAGREPVLEMDAGGGSAGMTGCAASGGTGGSSGTDTGGTDTGGTDTGGTDTGGTGGSSGTDTGGSSGEETGGSGGAEVGSGSRRDPGCACQAPGGRPLTLYAWFGLALAAFAAARRRNRGAEAVLASSGHDERS